MAKKSTKGKLPVAPVGAEICSAPRPYKPSKEDQARERRYKAEDALRSIERAEEVKRDKDLMKDVKQLAKEKVASLSKIK